MKVRDVNIYDCDKDEMDDDDALGFVTRKPWHQGCISRVASRSPPCSVSPLVKHTNCAPIYHLSLIQIVTTAVHWLNVYSDKTYSKIHCIFGTDTECTGNLQLSIVDAACSVSHGVGRNKVGRIQTVVGVVVVMVMMNVAMMMMPSQYLTTLSICCWCFWGMLTCAVVKSWWLYWLLLCGCWFNC